MGDRCPGSGHQTGFTRWIVGDPEYVACPYCKRGFAVNLNGRIRRHKGLPARPDGGCPYSCPPSCDFGCYFHTPEKGAV